MQGEEAWQWVERLLNPSSAIEERCGTFIHHHAQLWNDRMAWFRMALGFEQR